jgi:hypothetical protein
VNDKSIYIYNNTDSICHKLVDNHFEYPKTFAKGVFVEMGGDSSLKMTLKKDNREVIIEKILVSISFTFFEDSVAVDMRSLAHHIINSDILKAVEVFIGGYVLYMNKIFLSVDEFSLHLQTFKPWQYSVCVIGSKVFYARDFLNEPV